MKKRLLSLILTAALALSLLPTCVLAGEGDDASAATVSFTAQGAGLLLCAPQWDVTVSGSLAESYGYSDSVDGVSALDVLVRAHELALGDAFAPETAGQFLAVSDSGFVSTLFGVTTYASGFILNGMYPHDGTASPYGGYNGTTVTTQAVTDGDLVEFFLYQDESGYSDQIAWFSQGGHALTALSAAPESSLSLTLRGAMYMVGYLYRDADALHAAGDAVASAQLAWVDAATGQLTDIAGALTTADGTVTLTAPAAEGTYYLTAYMPASEITDNYASPIVMPLLPVRVVEGYTPPAPESDPCALTALSVASFDSNPDALAMTPAFSPETTAYAVPQVDYQSASYLRMVYVKAASENHQAVITAAMNGVTAAVTSGDGTWKMLPGALKPGSNTLTVTVAASDREDAATRTYTVSIPMGYDPAAQQTTITMNAVSTTARLYAIGDTSKADDLLAGVSPQERVYSTYLTDGDYLLEGYDASGTLNGSLVLTVAAGENAFRVLTATNLYAANSGWERDTDYTISLTVQDQSNAADRRAVAGTQGSAGRASALCLYGDTIRVTYDPTEARGDYVSLTRSATLTSNQSYGLSGSLPQGVDVVFTAPAGSVICVGSLSGYYIYTFETPTATSAQESVSATYRLGAGNTYFYRVQHPGGVTYWNYASWQEDAAVAVTAQELCLNDTSFTPATVYHDFSANRYDMADLYLSVNAQGYLPLNPGDTYPLNAFRSWMAIEGTSNAQVALPDMHYTVLNLDGTGHDGSVVTVTPDPGNSSMATLSATGSGSVIVLVTYDAMTSAVALGGSRLSAIWPENTGVFVVCVGADGSAIQTNMTVNEGLNSADAKLSGDALDAEHDVLYYTGAAGASYTFTPEAGCTVSVSRSAVGESMTFSGFTTDGVATDESGAVSVSALTTGRHIVRIEKDGVATYQVITAKEARYTLQNPDGTALTAAPKAGDQVVIQFTGLYNPAEKQSGTYNFSPELTLFGEDDARFVGTKGSSFGYYLWSSTAAHQKVTVTIPKYWPRDAYSLTGAIHITAYGSAIGAHRTTSYAAGRNPSFSAISQNAYLGVLPQITLNLAPTDFLTSSLTFADESGNPVDPAALTVALADSDGNAVTVAADGSFQAPAGDYRYRVCAAGYQYLTGALTVSAQGSRTFAITLQSTAPGAWDGVSVAQPAREGEVYQIATGANLAWLAQQTNGGNNALQARLVNDIDLAGYPWSAIGVGGSSSQSFRGVFDGDGKTISNLYYNGGSLGGLFGGVGSGGVIQSLTLRGQIDTAAGSVGGLVGYASGSASAPCVIENCVSYVNVRAGGDSAGSLAGYAYHALIRNCATHGFVSGGSRVGGLVGYLMDGVTLTGCYATGAVTGSGSGVGGLVGDAGDSSAITACYSMGPVTGTGQVGGLMGASSGSAVTDCYSVGTVTGSSDVGGFAGAVTESLVTRGYYLDSAADSDAAAQALTATQLRSADLDESYFAATCGGYPALLWQSDATFHVKPASGTLTAPTCTERGYTAYTCTGCGSDFLADYTPATGHRAEAGSQQAFPGYTSYCCAICQAIYRLWDDTRLAYMTLPQADATGLAMADNGSYPWEYNQAAGRFESGNRGVNRSTSETTLSFTLTHGGRLALTYGVSCESGYDRLTITLSDDGGTTISVADAISGSVSDAAWQQTLDAGRYTLTLSYTKDGSAAGGDDLGYVSALALTAYSAQQAQDAAAAAAVVAQIAAIGQVTPDKESAIDAALLSYNTLTPAQQALVRNHSILVDAQSALAALKNPTTGGESGGITVSFRLIGATRPTRDVDLSRGEAGYYGGDYVTWVQTRTYTLNRGATAGDLFRMAMADAGLKYQGLEGNYLTAIHAPAVCGGYALSEMDGGPLSGWMYTVNGVHANRGLNTWTLSEGDAVVFHYVFDPQYECSDWSGQAGLPPLGDGALHNRWLTAADVTPDSAQQGEPLPEGQTPAGPLPEGLPFSDVDSHWALEGIRYVYEHALMVGVESDSFAPDSSLSRAMLVSMLYRLEGLPAVDGADPFADVAEDAWYADAVDWAESTGIVSGVGGGLFSPDGDITREQMAVMLNHYARYKGWDVSQSAALTGFSDGGAVSPWAREALQWATAAGLITGRSQTTLAPDGTATRAEAATLFMRFVQSLVPAQDPPVNDQTGGM